ncbi:MAG: C45 family peptidase [Muribaculaceae bacterium]|nr:C45 family peptidase [Muribaculaceae bacterium]
MKQRIGILICLIAGFFVPAVACTSAIIGAELNPYGRPLLWKHRDTSSIDNKVEYVAPGPEGFGYTGLFNASDRKLRECWTGFNSEGFAIMNTASYNLKDDSVPQKDMDKEGFVMTKALRTCVTVDDFARLLDSLPRPMGVEANFGVIDATGAGAYFETNNHSYIRINLEDSPEHMLVRTNYSHCGRPDEGYGFVREANALHLLRPAAEKKNVTPEFLTETLSRTFYHSLMDKDMAEGLEEGWIIDQDFIPRFKSCATIVIEGCVPSEKGVPKDAAKQYVMWTGLGYPPCADIYPVTEGPDGVHPDLRGIQADGHSKASDISRKRRDEVFPKHYGNGDKYIRLSRLRNPEGTGYLQIIPKQNLLIYQNFRDKMHSE